MRQLWNYMAFGLLVLGCAEQQVPRPENLIPQTRMADILYDIAVLHAIDGSYPKALKNSEISVMAFVYEKYGIDSLQLTQSDLYYASRPVEYEAIYKAVEDRVAHQRDSINDVVRGANEKGRDDLKKQQAEEKAEED